MSQQSNAGERYTIREVPSRFPGWMVFFVDDANLGAGAFHGPFLSMALAKAAIAALTKRKAVNRKTVSASLVAQPWTFAKTMPNNPHEWTHRKTWSGDVPFDDVVLYIREHGYLLEFDGKPYVCLDVGPHRYWTMGAPPYATVLINRARNR